MERSGKWLILAILGIALAGGSFSWWFRWSATHRAAAFWGPEAATTIRDARKVEAFRLADGTTENSPTLTAGGREYPIEQRIDATQGHGLVHLKQALFEDRSYDWTGPPNDQDFSPVWALVFHPPATQISTKTVMLLFDDACTHGISVVEGIAPQPIPCEPIAPGLKTLFTDWFSAD